MLYEFHPQNEERLPVEVRNIMLAPNQFGFMLGLVKLG